MATNTVDARRALRTQGLTGQAAEVRLTLNNQATDFAVTEDVEQWCRDPIAVLNAFGTISAGAASRIHESVRYQGFNKMEFIDSWVVDHGFSSLDMIKIAFVAAVRGTNVERLRPQLTSPALGLSNANVIVTALVNGDALIKNPTQRMSPNGRRAVTMNRCAAVVPHIVAAVMKRAAVPARYPDLDLPAHLQFPAAASIPLSATRRDEHIQFNNQFSEAISAGRADRGGRQMTIYNQQVAIGLAPLTMPDWVRRELAGDITVLAQQ